MKTFHTSMRSSRLLYMVFAVCLIAVFAATLNVSAATYTPLTSQLSLGASGSDVTNLQTFLAANTSICAKKLSLRNIDLYKNLLYN